MGKNSLKNFAVVSANNSDHFYFIYLYLQKTIE